MTEEYRDEPMSRHTTFKIGGPAERLIVPGDRKDLLEILGAYARNRIPFFVLGRGSNTLFKDEGMRGIVIKNTAACTELNIDGNDVTVGASVTLQRLISACVKSGLYGMEYLSWVPGNVGGAIYMNAGLGINEKKSISDHLVSVEVWDGGGIRAIKKEECKFEYRTSLFHRMKGWVVLSARFVLPRQDPAIGRESIKEWMRMYKEKLHVKYPNAGTVFRRYYRPLGEVAGHRVGNAEFSTKSPGWIVNLGGATFKDVYGLIRHARACHKRRGERRPELELVVAPQSRMDRVLGRYD
jgi:UDP-N-acetylmuramate dehydrogenase